MYRFKSKTSAVIKFQNRTNPSCFISCVWKWISFKIRLVQYYP